MNTTKLHYKTTTSRLKGLLRLENFNEVRVTSEAAHTYWAEFPTGEIIQIWAAPALLVNVVYHSKDERGELNPAKHEIAAKLVFAIHQSLESRREINMFEKDFMNDLTSWARAFGRGYRKYMKNSLDVLNA